MTETTVEYCSWMFLMGDSSINPESYVTQALGGHVEEFDVDAIVADFRAAVGAILPDGADLVGDAITGPEDGLDRFHARLPEIRRMINAINFWEIARRHDKTPEPYPSYESLFTAHTRIPNTDTPGLADNMAGYSVEIAVRVAGTIAKLSTVQVVRADFDAALGRPATPDDAVTVTARVSPVWVEARNKPWDNLRGPQ